MELVPPGFIIVISTVPVPAGAIAVRFKVFCTLKLIASLLPNFTAVVLKRLFPLIETKVPPMIGPFLGEIALTVGGVTYVNLSLALVALVPPTVVTVTSTVPVPAGEVAVI